MTEAEKDARIVELEKQIADAQEAAKKAEKKGDDDKVFALEARIAKLEELLAGLTSKRIEEEKKEVPTVEKELPTVEKEPKKVNSKPRDKDGFFGRGPWKW